MGEYPKSVDYGFAPIVVGFRECDVWIVWGNTWKEETEVDGPFPCVARLAFPEASRVRLPIDTQQYKDSRGKRWTTWHKGGIGCMGLVEPKHFDYCQPSFFLVLSDSFGDLGTDRWIEGDIVFFSKKGAEKKVEEMKCMYEIRLSLKADRKDAQTASVEEQP